MYVVSLQVMYVSQIVQAAKYFIQVIQVIQVMHGVQVIKVIKVMHSIYIGNVS